MTFSNTVILSEAKNRMTLEHGVRSSDPSLRDEIIDDLIFAPFRMTPFEGAFA